jgi:hypothetical protein
MPSSMSSDAHQDLEKPEDNRPAKGPNLILIYCLLGVAFLLAISIAVLIVLPFYHRH